MATPRLCVTVTANSTAELRRRRDGVRDADLVELRLDGVADPDVAGALADRRLPTIITCRPEWEGGRFAGSEEERRRILGEALARGAEFVDIEWRAGFGDLIAGTKGRRVVLSSHDFESLPADLADRARAMRATGAEVIKLAVTANRLSDCVQLVELGSAFGRDGRMVLIAMGARGLVTRVLPQRFFSEWSYGGSLGTVGQLSPDTMLNLYRFRSLGAGTALYGLVGSPIDHSVSPDMHNAALAATSVDGVYLPFPAVDAADFVTFARALGLKGASITIPFKVALFDHVNEVKAVAQHAGAINTLAVEGQRWIGGNTDVAGFMQPLLGADVTVHARDAGRALDTARAVGVQAAPWPPTSGSWDLLVNCTPVGMYPRVDQSPVPSAALSGRYVYDLIYNPPATRLLRDAAAAGCTTFGGLDMLVAQAQEQFSWWTGIKAPAGVMRAAAERRLTEFIADENHVV